MRQHRDTEPQPVTKKDLHDAVDRSVDRVRRMLGWALVLIGLAVLLTFALAGRA